MGTAAMSIVIENDGQYTLAEGIGKDTDPAKLTNEEILGRVKERLPADCRYLGGFMCPGKMGMGIRRRYEAMLEANPEDSRAKMLLENFDAVLDRPNDQDLEALTNWARSL